MSADEAPFDLDAINEAFTAYVPHNRALGLQVVHAQASPAVAVIRLPWDERFVGNPETGVLHGGVISTLVDATCGAAVFFKLRDPTPIATLDLRLDFLGPARPRRDVFARAECFKTTHNVAFVRAVAYQESEDDPLASAAGTFMLSTRGKGVTEYEAAKRGPP